MIPYLVDVPMQRWPYANWALIAVTTIVSVAWLAGPNPGPGMLLSVDYFKVYQPLTAALTHGGPWHLFGNMLFLFVFGFSLGKHISMIEGFTYLEFIVPGLVIMSIINNSYQNTASSILISKFR